MTLDRPRRADMDPHVQQLKDLASSCLSIIEIGVGTYCSTFALLDGLPPDGKLVSVDIEGSVHPDAAADPRWRFVHGNSTSVETFRQLPHGPDLMFIDSGHGYELTWQELLIADFLRPTRIALHDYLFPLELDPLCRVKQAVDEFLEAGHYRWEDLHESMWGLAVLVRA